MPPNPTPSPLLPYIPSSSPFQSHSLFQKHLAHKINFSLLLTQISTQFLTLLHSRPVVEDHHHRRVLTLPLTFHHRSSRHDPIIRHSRRRCSGPPLSYSAAVTVASESLVLSAAPDHSPKLSVLILFFYSKFRSLLTVDLGTNDLKLWEFLFRIAVIME
ncbi:hypothetical protein AAHA92_15517 [Salvia divinorum]|uniref:Uncharacterized protein n=1 Tax=Salvia divinorum TaxID=28513 RepID=A0ABD1HFU4_SALDI